MSLFYEPLRRRALARLGHLGDAVARELLDDGDLDLERDVNVWEGSHGRVHAHRVVVRAPAALARAYAASPASQDALTAALAAAIAEEPGNALADVRVEAGEPRGESPYRG